ncbi:MAG: 30S ribosomal protein S6 [Thermomicrobiales bacterium]
MVCVRRRAPGAWYTCRSPEPIRPFCCAWLKRSFPSRPFSSGVADERPCDRGKPTEGVHPLAAYIRDPRAYELMVMIVPDISDEEIAEELTRIQKYISDINAELTEILTDSPWGRRRLAYTIRFNSVDYRDGFYAVIHFSARPDSLGELERELKLDTRVIRYLLVHDDPKAGIREPNNPDRATETEAAAAPVPEAPVAEAPATEAAPVETTEAPATEETAAEPVAVEATEAPAEEAPAESSEEE